MEKHQLETSALETLALEAHHARVDEERKARVEEARERERIREARRRPPRELGLEECPGCGWWRSPVPETARRSPDAFRTWLKMARARCMCTTDRCPRCDEPLSSEVPTPVYYSEDRSELVRSGSFVMGMAHSARCRAERDGEVPAKR